MRKEEEGRPQGGACLPPNDENRGSGVDARRQLFEKYAESYHERFRAAIDYQFAEEPRQVYGIFVLVSGCVLFGALWDRIGTDVDAGDYAPAIRSAVGSVLFGTLVYCFLQVMKLISLGSNVPKL